MEQLESVIREIIEKEIPQRAIFDAHAVIDFLIQNQSDIYLNSHSQGGSTQVYHSRISKIIASCTDLVEQIGDGWSRNIHQNFFNNKVYRKK